ncbi:hypothetical protein ACFW1F_30625 [Streptomyces bungoensis]|uniref:hypothetical protein n=1 Tax=Streptomyces bungoensis TaxID=285568 RepID=UPI0036C71850
MTARRLWPRRVCHVGLVPVVISNRLRCGRAAAAGVLPFPSPKEKYEVLADKHELAHAESLSRRELYGGNAASAAGSTPATGCTLLNATKTRLVGADGKTVSPTAAKAVRAEAYSTNWGGYVANGHSNYNEVYNDQNIPKYYTDCGADNKTLAAPWIGLGGYNSAKLIQQGFASGSSVGSTTQGVSLWYEYLNAAHQNPPVYIGHTLKTGHVISQYMTYSSGKVGFHGYDRTAGSGWSPVNVSGLSSYYDGSTADYITERPYGFKLRKFSKQTFSAAGARYVSTFKDLFKLPNNEVRLTTNGRSSGAALFTDTRSSASAFSQTWKRCS